MKPSQKLAILLILLCGFLMGCSQTVYLFQNPNENKYILANGEKVVYFEPGMPAYPVINDFGDTLDFEMESMPAVVAEWHVTQKARSFEYRFGNNIDTLTLTSAIQTIDQFPCMNVVDKLIYPTRICVEQQAPYKGYYARYIRDTTFVCIGASQRAHLFEFYPKPIAATDTMDLKFPNLVIIGDKGIPLFIQYRYPYDQTVKIDISCSRIRKLKGGRKRIMNHLL